ncbi:MAG: hypothetical protein ACR2NP_04375 [Pirellulaceae bacterium]
MKHASAWKPGRRLLAATILIIAGWSCEPVSAQLLFQMSDTLGDIAALGADGFQQRQQAHQKLLESGTDAYDWLLLAQYSSNQEIARRAHRLLQQIDYGTELTALDRSLAGYRQQDFAGRAKLIIRLGRKTDEHSQMALALIARFEDDEVLSRNAAIELIEGEAQDVDAIAQSLSTSMRTASRWIRAWTESTRQADRLQATWQPLIDQLLADSQARRAPGSTCRLLKWYSGQLLARGERASSDQINLQLIGFLDERPMDVTEFFDWLLMHERYTACNELIARFAELMDSEPRLLFRRAELVRMQGDLAAATRLARQAADAVGAEPLLHLQSAINLQYASLNYWAYWQLDRVIEDEAAAPTVRVQACQLQAEMQFTDQRFLDAANTLKIALDILPVPGEPAVSLLQDAHGNPASRRSYFLHLDALSRGDDEAARQHLLDGIAESPENSDLLIAMSRFSDSSQAWLENSRLLVEIALQNRQEQITQLQIASEEDPRQNRLREVQLAQELNGYAWLAGQSGFDLVDAEKSARQAAELAPSNSRILDTLASCMFAAGKYREAVVIQQQAIRHNPNSLQLRAGLSQYRQAMLLAELPNFFR